MLKQSMQIYFDPEVVGVYKDYAKITKRSFSDVIRESLMKNLNEIQDKLKKISSDDKQKKNADFWALAGSLKSNIKLTDAQLHQAREAFAQSWSKTK